MKSLGPWGNMFFLAVAGCLGGCGDRANESPDGGDSADSGGADATPDSTRSGICAPATDASFVPTCNDAAAVAASLGRWSLCGGSMPGAPSHDGIEFAVGGDFYFLSHDAGGGFARSAAAANHGTVRAATGPNCMMTTEILTAAGGRFWSTARPYDTSPRQLWIYTDPEWEDPKRYTFVGP